MKEERLTRAPRTLPQPTLYRHQRHGSAPHSRLLSDLHTPKWSHHHNTYLHQVGQGVTAAAVVHSGHTHAMKRPTTDEVVTLLHDHDGFLFDLDGEAKRGSTMSGCTYCNVWGSALDGTTHPPTSFKADTYTELPGGSRRTAAARRIHPCAAAPPGPLPLPAGTIWAGTSLIAGAAELIGLLRELVRLASPGGGHREAVAVMAGGV